jgi:hypothetical protein
MPLRKRPESAQLSLLSCEDKRKTCCLQIRKQPSPDLESVSFGLSSFQNCEKEVSVVYEILWNFGGSKSVDFQQCTMFWLGNLHKLLVYSGQWFLIILCSLQFVAQTLKTIYRPQTWCSITVGRLIH